MYSSFLYFVYVFFFSWYPLFFLIVMRQSEEIGRGIFLIGFWSLVNFICYHYLVQHFLFSFHLHILSKYLFLFDDLPLPRCVYFIFFRILYSWVVIFFFPLLFSFFPFNSSSSFLMCLFCFTFLFHIHLIFLKHIFYFWEINKDN